MEPAMIMPGPNRNIVWPIVVGGATTGEWGDCDVKSSSVARGHGGERHLRRNDPARLAHQHGIVVDIGRGSQRISGQYGAIPHVVWTKRTELGRSAPSSAIQAIANSAASNSALAPPKTALHHRVMKQHREESQRPAETDIPLRMEDQRFSAFRALLETPVDETWSVRKCLSTKPRHAAWLSVRERMSPVLSLSRAPPTRQTNGGLNSLCTMELLAFVRWVRLSHCSWKAAAGGVGRNEQTLSVPQPCLHPSVTTRVEPRRDFSKK
jgi:hypothetical protein